MNRERIKKVTACILLIAAFAALAGCGAAPAQPTQDLNEAKKTITIQDSSNRTVEVPYPVESIVVLWNNPTEIITALGAVDRIVGIDTATKGDVDKGFYPELKDTPVIGSCEEPNYEKIAELDPDVVLMLTSYPPLPDEVSSQLESFGIPVVALDFYNTSTFYREITTLGTMLGQESKAKELISLFDDTISKITTVVSEIPDDERKSVYFEAAADFKTYGGAGDGCGIPEMIRMAGGIDLYPEIAATVFEVNPEDIATRNPDIIIKGQNDGYFLTDSTSFKEVNDIILARPEFSNTAAIKNNDVYTMSFNIAGGTRKIFGPMYLAKILYPEKFEDLNPDAVLKEYLETYLGRTWQGVYVYHED